MTQDVLKQALEALEANDQLINGNGTKGGLVYCMDNYYSDCFDVDPINKQTDEAIAAIKEALAQPEQEPVGDDWTPCMKLPVVVYVRKQRLGESHVSTREGITPVKEDDLIMRGVSGEEYPIGRAIFEQTYSLNTAPPQRTEPKVCCQQYDTCLEPCTPRGRHLAQRTWVGLTDEEFDYLRDNNFGVSPLISAVEAKLKQKNG